MTNEFPLPLEDSHLDILGKAQRGLKLSDEELAQHAGISSAEFAQIQEGEILLESLGRLATALHLGPQALIDAARKAWQPEALEIKGLKTFTTPFEDMTVNSYLVWDAASKKAAAFDSGADAGGMLDFAAANGLTIELILITHTHGDHIFDLDRLRKKSGAPAWLGDKEPTLAGTESFAAGKSFHVGGLTIDTRLTWGHADGGITYVVSGLPQPLAIVGDAIFAGSMGGGKVSYDDALRTTREEILSLPDETIVASGHGPLTTVAGEKVHNPFFAA
jgi:glyoxylase-like metal-dependent hydrolase (beta-lactamase superfamily II)